MDHALPELDDRLPRSSTLLQSGIAAYRRGDFSTAAWDFSRILEAMPEHHGARVNLANALWSLGKLDAAEREAERARTDRPDSAEAWMVTGAIRLDRGDAKGAIAAYGQAVALRPGLASAHAGLGAAFLAIAEYAKAEASARDALALDPASTHARFTLGSARAEQGDPAAAVAAFDIVLAAEPGHARARLNRGNALVDLDRIAAAEADLRAAASLDPALKEAWASLGFVLTIQASLPAAIASCDRAIALDADFALAHWNRGVAMLLGGDFTAGFAAYEWRKRHPLYRHHFTPLSAPDWEGEPLDGKRLLVRAEQGFGDTIMLARFLPDLAARAARVTLACPPTLFPLFAGLGVGLHPLDQPPPEADCAIDQMSLPHRLGLTAPIIPRSKGYLAADPSRAVRWRAVLPAMPGRRKIGLVWAGNPGHGNDRRRSLPPHALAPLLERPGIDFVALQLGARHDEYPIPSLAPLIGDYGDTAAILAQLDAVVTVDTSIAHLAGAMGIPCHVLLSAACDWRWRLGYDTTPWYDSMVLHRQRRLGDWPGPIGSVIQALR